MRGSWLHAGSPLCLCERENASDPSGSEASMFRYVAAGLLRRDHLFRCGRLRLRHGSPYIGGEPWRVLDAAPARNHDPHRLLLIGGLANLWHCCSRALEKQRRFHIEVCETVPAMTLHARCQLHSLPKSLCSNVMSKTKPALEGPAVAQWHAMGTALCRSATSSACERGTSSRHLAPGQRRFPSPYNAR
jgi:hypothetical protein